MGILDAPGLSTRQKFALRPNRVPVVARIKPPHMSLSDGTKMGRLYHTRYTVMRSAGSMRVAFSNYYNDAGVGLGNRELDGPNDIIVSAAVGYPLGVSAPITGPKGVTIAPGQTVWLDLPAEVTAGDDIYFITQVAVRNLGEKWPTGAAWQTLSNEGFVDTNAAPWTDLAPTTGTGNLTFGQEWSYGPSAVIGVPLDGPLPSVLIVGDSISYGIGSSTNDISFISGKLAANNVPYQQLGLSGSTARLFRTPSERVRRMRVLTETYFTHAVYEYATNDLGFQTAMKPDAIASWQVLAKRGMKVYATTCTPHTSDAGGTTPAGNDASRVAYNDWLRAGAPVDNATSLTPVAIGTSGALVAGGTGHPLTGYFDAADIVETSRNSGAWKPGTTSDGLHPNQAAHTSMQACIDLTKLSI